MEDRKSHLVYFYISSLSSAQCRVTYPAWPHAPFLYVTLTWTAWLHVVHRPCASPTTSGGSGQSSVSQMARSSSASRTVTCWFARMQAVQAMIIRRLIAGTD